MTENREKENKKYSKRLNDDWLEVLGKVLHQIYWVIRSDW